MRKIFADTNILIDLIADRKPFSKSAIRIFDAAERKQEALFGTAFIVGVGGNGEQVDVSIPVKISRHGFLCTS